MPTNGPTCKTSSEIINGTTIPAEGSGVVFLGNCTGTLLRNDYVLTATHCEAMVGQPISMGSQSARISRVWNKSGSDVTMLQLDRPMSMNDTKYGYTLPIRADRPGVGEIVTCSGYGYNTFSPGLGSGEGTLRTAQLSITAVDETGFTIGRNASGQVPWLGDSGSTCIDQEGRALGVSSNCTCSCTIPPPDSPDAPNIISVNRCTFSRPDDIATWVQDVIGDPSRFVVNKLSGKCLDVDGAPGVGNGARAQLFDCEYSGVGPNGSPTDQKWQLIPDGFFVNLLSGRCLDVDGGPGTTDAARLHLFDCEYDGISWNGSPTDQRWQFTPDGFLQNQLTPSKCADVNGLPGTSNGAIVHLWGCEASGVSFNGEPTDQRWGATTGFLVNQLSGMCMDVDGLPGTATGAIIHLWYCEFDRSQTDQVWELTRDGFLRNNLSNKCVDVDGLPGTNNGAIVHLWDCEFGDTDTDQRWEITEGGFLRNLYSGKCLDVNGLPGMNAGDRLQLWDCQYGDPNTDQRWRFQR